MPSDPTLVPGRWDSLFEQLRKMDTDIEQFYVQQGVEGMRARFVRPLIRLKHQGPMTIAELSVSLDGTHSATSQTVAAMRRAGFVTSRRGTDGRTQVIRPTRMATTILPLLEQEWRATQAVVAGLDDELDGAGARLASLLENALTERTMSQRLADQLDADA